MRGTLAVGRAKGALIRLGGEIRRSPVYGHKKQILRVKERTPELSSGKGDEES